MNDTKPSLIYLDDEEINLILFNEMFKKDFEIFTTTNPNTAIEHVRNNQLDFVLTDQLMPSMTGVEFLKELKNQEISADSMKVIISGFTQEGEVDEALETRLIDHFVSKPWSYQNLKDLLLSKQV
ncbi:MULTISPECIES: response regulator [unclassified Ekhidna]|jgi:response regulator RpfG family c-di-GMP phosphodiesterase|uniref:response regulator n=1 Tax=unclassified Ekhidna TaxID=2632188 RepID=UPI0032DE9D6A